MQLRPLNRMPIQSKIAWVHNAVVWSAQSNQPLYTQVISTDEWITKHPELIARFLKSLAQAEEYVNTHPAEAKAIVQKRLNLDAGYMDTVWQQNQFSLSLDQSLIMAMEDEARWMIKNNLTAEKTGAKFPGLHTRRWPEGD